MTKQTTIVVIGSLRVNKQKKNDHSQNQLSVTKLYSVVSKENDQSLQLFIDSQLSMSQFMVFFLNNSEPVILTPASCGLAAT